MNKLAFGFICFFLCAAVWAQTKVEGVRVWASPERTRVVFDLSQSQKHHIFILDHPHRVVIDLPESTWQASLKDIPFDDLKVKSIRRGKRGTNGLRVVLDLSEPLTPSSFILNPQGQYGHRLVIDLLAAQEDIESVMESMIEPVKPKPSKPVASMTNMVERDFIIAIDAGHGGEDPGAIGKRFNTKEKDIVYRVAKRLVKMINRERGMRSFLVRDGDYYVGLRKRMQGARKQGADLFISLHADSFKNPAAHGASVYILSEHGASSEAARWLAESENKADLVGGVSLDDKGDILASVLLDLSQTANLSASEELGATVLRELGSVVRLHQTQVQRAGFAVLKSPDVPSILVELGFISNFQGEANLRTPGHQTKLAKAIFNGIRKYFSNRPQPLIPSTDHVLTMTYKVKKNDTLSGIAVSHNIPLRKLREANRLHKDSIYVGQLLKIPKADAS